MSFQWHTIDGNEAAALVAHRLNEVIAIYPITPASPMGEAADAWSAAQRKNLWGQVPTVVEMQSEGGAAGAVHGALQAGALTTTFTASQGLLLMIPNLFKIAGELTSTVIHVAARSVATHALSIFGDHSDVMAARSTGWAMLCGASVQEAHDFAVISQAASFASRLPFLHFFDGFRTSHEVNRVAVVDDDVLRAMIDDQAILAHRQRALTPDRPVLRGTAQNPDVFFQAREAANPFYDAAAQRTQKAMDHFAALTGRAYQLFEYVGHAEAERIVVLMGSGCGAVEEAVAHLVARDERVGVVKVRLYRPFDVPAFVKTLPVTTQNIAVLDRTKEPGAVGEPLYQDVLAALSEAWTSERPLPRVIHGRYGLSSKEFTPAMVLGLFRELQQTSPRRHFTIGIYDDVTHLSLPWDESDWHEPDDVHRAVFFGLGSDGTVGANKNTVKIVGESTDLFAQGYFVYDSKKSGSVTISHVRFSPRPIRSTYLIQQAQFIGVHQFSFLETRDVLSVAAPGATVLLNSPYRAEEIWSRLPIETQREIRAKSLKLYVIDGNRVADEAGLAGRINVVMQVCYFKLSGVIPVDDAIGHIKSAIEKSYGKRGQSVVRKNFAAVDSAIAQLQQVQVPDADAGILFRRPPVADDATDFVKRVTSMILAGRGDLLPVSALPVDGTFPTGTAKFEKRSIAAEIPLWDGDICIQCGLCAVVCPHAAIRSKAYSVEELQGAPLHFLSVPWGAKDSSDYQLTIQVAPDDCTGCGVCVDVCPARSKSVAKHKAINMSPKLPALQQERERYDFFLKLPEMDRRQVPADTIKSSQLLQPLFEYSGACAGCGETPYLKLLSQLFGERAIIANATGCSSIFGGNLPTTPWSTNAEGRGPAWSNSLFEDNAEFGLGIRLSVDQQTEAAKILLRSLAPEIGDDLVTSLLNASVQTESDFAAQRDRITALKNRLQTVKHPEGRSLAFLADHLIPRSVWIVGGDGWAYDIGYGGLDHVLSLGRNVNILVLDTEVYSNTGGQASKATPRGATAKFAASGKTVRKKDLGMQAVNYGSIYVAQVAIGAHPLQTLRVFQEAESYPGTSLIIAFSPCIAHGIDMSKSMTHQKLAVNSAFWPLYHYDPGLAHTGEHPFKLDSRKPTIRFRDYAMQEARFASLATADPETADRLFALAQRDIDDQWHFYEQMAGIERSLPEGDVLVSQ